MLTEYNALAHRGANSVCTWGLLHDKIINCLNLLAYIFVSLYFQDDSAESKFLSMSQFEGEKIEVVSLLMFVGYVIYIEI